MKVRGDFLGPPRSTDKTTLRLSEVITCDPSAFASDHTDLTVSNFIETSNGLPRFDQAIVLNRVA